MRLFELYQEERGSTFTHDGKEYDLNKVIRLSRNNMVMVYSVSDLAWILDYDTPSARRTGSANVNIPILIAQLGDKKVVIDGLHRLAKAVDKGMSTIKGKMVSDDVLQQCLISEEIR